MRPMSSCWYRDIWSLDILNQSWTETTNEQVEFLIKTLDLKRGGRILDLACGYGRHSLELARRGFAVTGVDITRAYIEHAEAAAERERLPAEFICSDIREVSFKNSFDAVINMADGAIGYLENDAENLKIFDIIAAALKPGGKHFMDIVNAGYADTHFPCRLWDAGTKGLTLSSFEWDAETRIMLYGQVDAAYGTELEKPEMPEGCPTRLYTLSEVETIMEEHGMCVRSAYADFTEKKASDKDIQLMVYSQKRA